MPPLTPNTAAAEAMLDAAMGAGADTAPGPATSAAPPVTGQGSDVVSTPAQPNAAIGRAVGAGKGRDGKGRFQRALAMLEGKDGTVEPAAEGEAAEAPAEGAPSKEPEAPKSPAELRREKLALQIQTLREKNEARRAQQQADGRARAAQEQAQRDAQFIAEQRRRWEAVGNDPVKAFQEMGLDVGETFLRLSEAARTASTPEAKIAAVEKHNQLLAQMIRERDEAHAAKEQALAVRDAEREFLSQVTADKYPHARAYVDDGELARLSHVVASRQRERGIEPTYASIAEEIEQQAAEHHANVLKRLPPASRNGTGAMQSAAVRTATEQPAGSAPRTKAQGTLSNDTASAPASPAPTKRKSLQERQRDAERLLSAQEVTKR